MSFCTGHNKNYSTVILLTVQWKRKQTTYYSIVAEKIHARPPSPHLLFDDDANAENDTNARQSLHSQPSN